MLDQNDAAATPRKLLGVAIACTALGAALRLAAPGTLGLSHFDEGAYAIGAAAVASGNLPGGLYHLQHWLSPPLFFGTAGVLARLFGSPDKALFAVAIGFGILTIPLTFVVTRRWFGAAAAGAAAAMVALSDYHTLFSRVGLTDTTFTFFLLLAVWLLSEAERRGSLPLAALGGLATGLAWNAKYHGWLALVIAGAAIVAPAVFGERRRLAGGIARLAIAAICAGLLFLPWYLWVSTRDGGYARVAAEHARFLTPRSAPGNALTQLSMQLYLTGWASRLAPLAALVAALALARPRAWGRVLIVWGPALFAAGWMLGNTATAAVLALAGVIPALLRARAAPAQAPWFALMLLAAFTVLTPLYTPYARLLMPWLVAAWTLAGLGVAELVRWSARESLDARRDRAPAALVFALAVAAVAIVRPEANAPWRPTTGLHDASQAALRLLPDSLPVFVLGEPAVAFYLRQAGREARILNRPAGLEEALRPGERALLVTGIYTRRVRGRQSFAAWRERHPDSARLLGTAPADVNDVRILDDFRPEGARRHRASPSGDYDLELFEITMPAVSPPTP